MAKVVDVGKIVGGLDPRKLQVVVDLVWNNKDDLVRLLAMAQYLPDMARLLATGLSEAGAQARLASVALVGEDGQSGAMPTMSAGAASLGTLSDQLGKVSGLVSDAAGGVEKVGIPTVLPTFTSVLGVKVIAGVEVKSLPLLAIPASKLGGAASTINASTSSVGDLAEGLETLAEVLAAVGIALGRLGDALDVTGKQAKSVVKEQQKKG